MPKIPVYATKKVPKVLKKKDGTLSALGQAWINLLNERNLDETHTREVQVLMGHKEPNANSHEQVKAWLYSLGWVPEHIQHKRDKKTGKVTLIPQIASKDAKRDGTGEICDSIKKLYEKEPKLELLEGLSVLSHRITVFKGFLENLKGEFIYPTCAGITNTLRVKHSIIVNLPAVSKKYGKEIRGSIIAKEGMVLCGADLASIEDSTKRHYIYDYDPEYVEEMNTPGYDPHLEIGILAGMLTREQADFYKKYEKDKDEKGHSFIPLPEDKEKYGKIKAIRTKAKILNFSATYKVGEKALARNSGMKRQEASKMLATYWMRNKAILDVERSLQIKEINGQRWLLNPVSLFWYSLRTEKDKFSTLNQGTAVYVFDIWLTYIRRSQIKVAFQMHDEAGINVLVGDEVRVRSGIQTAIEKVNKKLHLNIKIGCSIEFGNSYAATH